MRRRTGPRCAVLVAALPVRVLTAANAAIAGYLGALTLGGLRPPGRLAIGLRSTRFAIFVPAHDEERVIADTLRSFQATDYPSDRFEVHVVADNCTDDTATIVREHGWYAHERADLASPGKGPALNWLFDRLDAELDADVIVVVDADTVLDPGFLDAMDRAFENGAVVAQGYYSVKDPGESTSAGIRYAALACRHHLRALGRNRLGASCGLYGNGMAFRRDVLRARRWSGHLVEDAEFQMELLLEDGIVVRYVPDARLWAEMPSSHEAATSQNERWERGRIEMARRYVPRLLRRFRRAPLRQRVVYADAVADHLTPPLSLVVVLQLLGLGLATLGSFTTRGDDGRRKFTRRAILHVATIMIVGLHVIAGLLTAGAPTSVYRSLVGAPRAILWKVRLWVRALRSKNDITWRRTMRNSER